MPTCRPIAVRFDDERMWVDVADGRVIGVPLARFPRLQGAAPAALRACELSAFGLHWGELDEDILADALFRGVGGSPRPAAA